MEPLKPGVVTTLPVRHRFLAHGVLQVAGIRRPKAQAAPAQFQEDEIPRDEISVEPLMSSHSARRARSRHKTSPSGSAASSRRIRYLRIALIAPIAVLIVTILLVLPWRWIPPPTTAFILRERVLREEPVHYRWIPRAGISSNLAIAAVAAEDQKFPDHSGFDWVAIREALERNQEGERVRGGSTISQQVAKNLFLWPGQSWVRKGMEAYLTVWIELLWPKRRILEVYLNVAEFGPGVFGVGAAADRLIGTSPAELTPYQAAILVAVLPSPKRMSAADPSPYVRTRASQIQAAVGALGGASYLRGS